MITLDVVLRLPGPKRELAISASAEAARQLTRLGDRAAFRLGAPFPGIPAGACEPHISLFMLALPAAEVAALGEALAPLVAGGVTIPAVGERWGHNPQGAPELHYRHTADWDDLQRSVVEAAEPLRHGRLREVDPAGDRLSAVIADLAGRVPGDARLAQLQRYGYDEIGERFSPHVTVAWPLAGARIPLEALPSPDAWTGELTELAAYEMGPRGTCLSRVYPDGPKGGYQPVHQIGSADPGFVVSAD